MSPSLTGSGGRGEYPLYGNSWSLFSDNLSSIESMQGNQSTTPDILAAVQIELNEIERHNLTVTFEWLPAHVGIMGNETADYGAKTALAIANNDMLTDIPLGINEVVSKSGRHYINKRQEDWDQTPIIWHYNIKPTVKSKRPGCKNPLIDKNITKLRLGASHQLNARRFRIQNGSADCECSTREDMKHYLLDCTLHDSHRRAILEHITRDVIIPKLIVNPDKQNKIKTIIFQNMCQRISGAVPFVGIYSPGRPGALTLTEILATDYTHGHHT